MRRSPQRSCVGCRKVRGKADLVRIVYTQDGGFAVDPSGKMPGRGAYICPEPACLRAAVKRKGFDRAFRQAVPAEAVRTLETAVDELFSRPGGSPMI